MRTEPSVAGWAQLCQRLSALSGAALTDGIRQAERALDGWPDPLRRAPASWWRHLARGEPEPRMRLARVLSPGGSALRDDELGRLIRSRHIQHIRHLELSFQLLTTRAAHILAASPWLAQIQTLTLCDNDIETAGAMALLGSPLLRDLQHLDLSGCPVGDSFVQLLLTGTELVGMRHLALARCGLTDTSAVAVATSPQTESLLHLSLAENSITIDGARRLAAAPHLRALQHLDLSGCPIGREGREFLFWSNNLSFSARSPYRSR